MNKLFAFILLLLPCTLFSGWKWEKLDIEVPYTYYLKNAAYDPTQQKIVILNASGEGDDALTTYDTWTFDGKTFEYVCKTTYPSSLKCWMRPQGLVFDENLQELTLFQICGDPGNINVGLSILKRDESLCWKIYKTGGSPLTAYDTVRKRAVSFLWGDNKIIEFDGSRFYTFPQAMVLDSNASVAFNPETGSTVYVGTTNFGHVIEVWEWGGVSLRQIEAPYPNGVDPQSGAGIQYNPEIRGLIGIVTWESTMIYNDYKWRKIIGLDTPVNGPMVYYPIDGKFYLFSIDAVYVLRRSHERPFEKD
ncbi:MAG TPA: hypothetical protein PK014_07855 [Thermoanaerobaculia bacterium]|nr:hypothetical protein [Thermoanaerobaculia bacterium]HUM30021.1 hypothetical protein [Thermoanaerobaculia bacterium]HXK68290.1 hypothetical protein [Thermoanaerobaculia bacterium]